MSDISTPTEKKSSTPAAPKWPYPAVTVMTADVRRNQWVKCIRSKNYSFGVIWTTVAGKRDPGTFSANAEAALRRYQADGPALHAGLSRDPVRRHDGMSVGEMCGLYLQNRKADVEAGTLTQATYLNYQDTCNRMVEVFGFKRLVEGLEPLDFAKLMRAVPFGPTRMGSFVVWAKQVFAWAFDNKVIERPPMFGKKFRGGTPKEKRELRTRTGKKLFTAEQIRAMAYTHAGVELRAMILLAINTGMGNTDCSELPMSALDLDAPGGAWLRFPRVKTSVDRLAPLWPETVAALREAIAQRPPPANAAHADRVFLTSFGRPWVHGTTNAVYGELAKVLKAMSLRAPGSVKAGKKEKGRSRLRLPAFQALRSTFRTVADEAKDQHAAFLIMGHVIPGMAGVYVQEIARERLVAVAEHVRRWLFDGWTCPWPSSTTSCPTCRARLTPPGGASSTGA